MCILKNRTLWKDFPMNFGEFSTAAILQSICNGCFHFCMILCLLRITCNSFHSLFLYYLFSTQHMIIVWKSCIQLKMGNMKALNLQFEAFLIKMYKKVTCKILKLLGNGVDVRATATKIFFLQTLLKCAIISHC